MKKTLGMLILYYLRSLAKLQLLKNSRAVIIGITGSAGKTSTRKAITLILKSKGIVKESVRANSESGIPLNILGLTMENYSALSWLKVVILAPFKLITNWERFDYYVVEMGIDSPVSPKNMSYLLSIIRPDVGVVLNAGLVHGAYFDHLVVDRDPTRRAEKIVGAIATEKMKLALGIKPTGFAVVNMDQKELAQGTKGLQARLLSIGKKKNARLSIDNLQVGKNGFELSFSYQNREYKLALPDLYEESYAYTFASAIAVAAGLGIPVENAVTSLSTYRAPAGRMRVFNGINGTTLLDSSYNSSPATVESALKLLKKVGGKSPKIAIIGDMRELGKASKFAHKQLAEWLLKYTDQALLFGHEVEEYTYPVLVSRKFPVMHFGMMSSLVNAAFKLPSGSAILIKGSQNTILLERVVQALLLDPKDESKLCRRGPYWDKLREKSA